MGLIDFSCRIVLIVMYFFIESIGSCDYLMMMLAPGICYIKYIEEIKSSIYELLIPKFLMDYLCKTRGRFVEWVKKRFVLLLILIVLRIMSMIS